MSVANLSRPAPIAVTAPSLRRACAKDATALSAFFRGLSANSRRLRFHGGCVATTPAMALRLCAVDGRGHQAWLAWVGNGDDAVVVGEARFVVSACGRSAELAIAVADDWQGRGVAQALMRQLLDAARAAGVSDLYGEVLDDNLRMQAFMRGLGFEVDLFARSNPLRMSRDLGNPARQVASGGWLTWLSGLLSARGLGLTRAQGLKQRY